MPDTTAGWQVASAAFFVYIAAVGLLLPGLAAAARRRAAAMACLGLVLTALAFAIPAHPVLHGWILPPALLLLAYWSSGALFVAPMPGAEAVLASIDARLRTRELASRAPRAVAELLELAYVFVYPLIPIALGLHIAFVPRPDVPWFWTVVLMTDFVCFGMLPWVQTRPPRALQPGDPWPSAVRRLNLRLLGAASIRVNTFPSGHAAEALAAVLLLAGAPLPVLAAVLAAALAISAGAVLGRYHYAADALAGWLVAIAVWMGTGG